jgi:hypothetical protein
MILGCGPARSDAKSVERDLAKAIPMQSSPAQVLNYLSVRGIEHSQYIHDAEQDNSINAVIRDKSEWKIVKTDIGIVFKFDKRDRLTGYDVRQHLTGP